MPEDKSIKKPEKKEFDEVESFVAEAPTVTIKGKQYKVRRLGIADIFKLGRILAVGAAGMGKDPELFPVDSILDILKVLSEHEDVKAFFIKLGALLKTPVFKEFSKKELT